MNQELKRKPKPQNGVIGTNAHDTNSQHTESRFKSWLIAVSTFSRNVILISWSGIFWSVSTNEVIGHMGTLYLPQGKLRLSAW